MSKFFKKLQCLNLHLILVSRQDLLIGLVILLLLLLLRLNSWFLRIGFKHHIQEQTHKNRKHDSLQFVFDFIKRLVDELAKFIKRLEVVLRSVAFKQI